jgi:hypothetical protein
MFATLGGKISADAPVQPSSRGAEWIIAYDAPVPAAFPLRAGRAFMIDVFSWRAGWRL